MQALMVYLRKVTLVIALALVCIATTAHGRCIVDGSSGLRLVTRVVNGVTTCPPGFVCPGFNPSNVSTFPVYCPPTPDCTVKRLQGKLCSTPMGTFEPYLCPAGHYCPNATQVLLCPSGTYCPYGQVQPRPCGGIARCRCARHEANGIR